MPIADPPKQIKPYVFTNATQKLRRRNRYRVPPPPPPCVLKTPAPAYASIAEAIVATSSPETRELRRALCGRLVPVWQPVTTREDASRRDICEDCLYKMKVVGK
jgi:hypothetical protein